jgi:hypothetical protein
MKAMRINSLVIAAAVIAIVGLNSCSDEYEDREIITNTYTGNIDVTSVGLDPAGDFTGNGDSGTFSFAWRNPQTRASANFDITSNTGSVQMIVKDNAGTVVLDRTLTAGGNDSYSGVSDAGEEGIWIVQMKLTDFNGDGSYSLHPGN